MTVSLDQLRAGDTPPAPLRVQEALPLMPATRPPAPAAPRPRAAVSDNWSALAAPGAATWKLYQVEPGGGLAWIATWDRPPTEEEVAEDYGSGRFVCRGYDEAGAPLCEAGVTISKQAAPMNHNTPPAPGIGLRELLPYLPQFVAAIRQAGGAPPAAAGLGIADLARLARLVKELSAPADNQAQLAGAPEELPADDRPPEAAPWWLPVVNQLAGKIIGPGADASALDSRSVALFLERPGNLLEVVQELQASESGAALLDQIRGALGGGK